MNRLAATRRMSLLFIAALVVAGPAAALLAAEGRGWPTALVLTAVGLALTLSSTLGLLLERELREQRTKLEEPPGPGRLTARLREDWRAWLRDDVAAIRTSEAASWRR